MYIHIYYGKCIKVYIYYETLDLMLRTIYHIFISDEFQSNQSLNHSLYNIAHTKIIIVRSNEVIIKVIKPQKPI